MTVGSNERGRRARRWPRILAGLIISLCGLLCTIGSAAIAFLPEISVGARIFGGVLCAVSLWVLARGIRLLLDRPVAGGGLMSPLALRAAAVLFVCLALGGLWTGYYREEGILAVLHGLGYLGVSAALWSMARARGRR